MSGRQSLVRTLKDYLSLWPILFLGTAILFISIHLGNDNFPELFSKERTVKQYYLTSFLKEISFALIIAWILAISVEKRSRSEQNRLIENYSRLSAKNIYSAIFERDVPENIANEVHDSIFLMPFFRSDVNLRIDLNKSDDGNYIILRNSLDFSMKNISLHDEDNKIDISISSPKHLRELARVHDIIINEKKVKSSEKETDVGVNFRYTFKMKPGEDAKVRIIYSKLKHFDDNELVTSQIATNGAHIEIEDHVGLEKVHLREIGRHYAKKLTVEEKNRHMYQISGVMLPHQGFLLWWESKHDQ